MLVEAPDPVRDFLRPRTESGRLLFTLTEAVIVGRRE
jgi:hypothetical protein